MRLRFGTFVLDSGTREVVSGRRAVDLSPKAFVFLELLLRNAPNALSKEELHESLWPGTFVSDGNLANLANELRSALGDDARRARFVRTVPRFGYAFIAPVVAEPRPLGRETETPDVAYRLFWGQREIALDSGENLIGRDREAVVWIDDESVSRRHARISVDGDGAAIEDLGSKNGTRVGEGKIRARTSLSDGDVVRIGPAVLTLRVLRRTGSTRTAGSRSSRADP
jgi:DNA-binding winged helix-turn-helix (wHTH) protein